MQIELAERAVDEREGTDLTEIRGIQETRLDPKRVT